MTRIVTRFSAAVLAVIVSIGLILPNSARADVYASQLTVTNPDSTEFDGNLADGTGALLSFILNDDATSVVVTIKEESSGSQVYQIDLGPQSAGAVTTTWDGEGSEDGMSYVFDVTATQDNYSNDEWTVFYDSGDINIFSRGGDVVTDMSSAWFGLTFAPNSGGPLGKGIAIYNADGSFHEPFLVAADVTSGGTVDWGGSSDSMFGGMFDDEVRFHVSAADHGEVRRLNQDLSLTTVVDGLVRPKGLWIDGTGADRVLYIADDSMVVRAAIGEDDVFTGDVEVVGEFEEGYPRNIALDDDGYLYVAFRESNDLASEPVGLSKFDISGELPVTEGDSEWSRGSDVTHRISSLEIDRGDDLESASDDVLYYATRAGNGTTDDGIWRVDDISDPFTTVTQIVGELQLYDNDSANINDRAAIALDAAGNFVLMENSNEHVFMISPPGEGDTNSFTTTLAAAFTVDQAVAAEDEELPSAYRLQQNYPNPFNPSTTIEFTLGNSGYTTVRVFDALGRQVRTLVSETRAAGTYRVDWDGTNDAGSSLSSGVYILMVSSGSFQDTIRMTLLK